MFLSSAATAAKLSRGVLRGPNVQRCRPRSPRPPDVVVAEHFGPEWRTAFELESRP